MITAVILVPGLGAAIGVSALVVIAVMAVAFIVGRIAKRYRDIDVFWPLGFVAVAVSCTLLLALVAIWGLRLAAHLAWRGRGQGEDPRYTMILRGAKGRSEVLYALKVVYGLQAALMFFVSLSVTVGMFAGRPIVALQILGAVVWLLGFAFESIGDLQLSRFKADPTNAGRVMDRGLWAWTRHPNYFGDACCWWGVFLVAAAGGWGLLTVLSPLVMNRLLTSVSGKPLLEARMAKTRAGFAEYVERTSPFFPRPPRRG